MRMPPWTYPGERYYYPWYDTDFGSQPPSDAEIKQQVLERLRSGPYENQYDLDVTVEKGVVILTGSAGSTVAKRAAGDDAWDTVGVTDVSNQLTLRNLA